MLHICDFLKNPIHSKQQVISYIAIGCAAHLEKKNIAQLENKHNQEFPPFLQDINRKFPDVHIRLILIDPGMEFPPYCIQKQRKVGNNMVLDPEVELKNQDDMYIDGENMDKWIGDDTFYNIFYNFERNISVYSFKEKATYFPYACGGDDIDLTKLLEIYHMDSINKNHLVFVHDFSGRSITPLSLYFDKKIHGNTNQVMYDICYRFDVGCYPDLELIKPQVIQNDDNMLTIFNPYFISPSSYFNIYGRVNESSKEILILTIKSKIIRFKNEVYANYRRIVLHFKDMVKNNYPVEKMKKFGKSFFVFGNIVLNEEFSGMIRRYKSEPTKELLLFMVEYITKHVEESLRELFSIFPIDSDVFLKKFWIQREKVSMYEFDKIIINTYRDSVKQYYLMDLDNVVFVEPYV
jgi:hypothetical protein